MFKRLWRWFLGSTADPIPVDEPDEPAPRRSKMFTTDALPSGEPTKSVGEYLGSLFEVAPKPVKAGTVDNGIDSAEGQGTGFIKSGYGVGSDGAGGMPAAITDWFLSQTFIGHQLAGLVAQHWLVDKCCLVPARDAVRHGFDIHAPDGGDLEAPEVLNLIKRLDKRFKLHKNLVELIYKGKIFGIRIAFFQVDSTDPQYYELPFNIDSVTPGSYKGIVQVDPYWCIPELDTQGSADPSSMHFYEPKYWVINGKRYHRSHLVIYREGDVIDILKPAYLYGGIPVPQKLLERVYAAERTANEAPQLALTKRTMILQTELEEGIALGPKYGARLAEVSELQSNYAVTIGDTEDKYTQFDTTLADLDVVIMSQFQLVAATANVPGTKLLMTAPKGFNATGEYDEASYHEELESIQSGAPTELAERHHQLLMYSVVLPAMRKRDVAWEPLETVISWAPLDSPTAKEYAEINLLKAQTGQALVTSGALDGYDERDRVRADKDSGYTGIAEALRPDEDADGEPDAPKVGAPVAPAQPGFDAAEDEPQLITNQLRLDPAIVEGKRGAQDYDVQVSPVIMDVVTGKKYRVVIDGHHSLGAARLDGVPPQLIEGGYGESDYFDADSGSPL
jgi:phage-related protein (TIGR01555 family)